MNCSEVLEQNFLGVINTDANGITTIVITSGNSNVAMNHRVIPTWIHRPCTLLTIQVRF